MKDGRLQFNETMRKEKPELHSKLYLICNYRIFTCKRSHLPISLLRFCVVSNLGAWIELPWQLNFFHFASFVYIFNWCYDENLSLCSPNGIYIYKCVLDEKKLWQKRCLVVCLSDCLPSLLAQLIQCNWILCFVSVPRAWSTMDITYIWRNADKCGNKSFYPLMNAKNRIPY